MKALLTRSDSLNKLWTTGLSLQFLVCQGLLISIGHEQLEKVSVEVIYGPEAGMASCASHLKPKGQN